MESYPLEGFQQFVRNSTHKEAFVDFFQSFQLETGFKTAVTLLSVGPGDGELDCTLIRECLPRLASYTGIENDTASFNKLQENCTGMRDGLSINLVNCQFEDFLETLVQNHVDVVLMLHVVYCFEDKMLTMIHKATNLLKDGGSLVIGVHDAINNIFEPFAPKTVTWDGAVSNCLKELSLVAQEYSVCCEFKPHGNFDKRFADYVLGTKASEKDLENMLTTSRSACYQGTSTLPHYYKVFVVRKT